jgi:hypothetical protein
MVAHNTPILNVKVFFTINNKYADIQPQVQVEAYVEGVQKLTATTELLHRTM